MKHSFKTPLGVMLVEGNEHGLTAAHFTSAPPKAAANPPPHFKEAECQLQEYCAGKRKTFDLPLIYPPRTSAFRAHIWKAMCTIPFGQTVSYKELAARAGNPKACRAAGGACNKNPFSIIQPCHRIVGADGSLTGFASGLDVKKKLLAHEMLHYQK